MPALFIALFHIACFISIGVLLTKSLVRRRLLPEEMIFIGSIVIMSLLYYLLFFIYVASPAIGHAVNLIIHISGLVILLSFIYKMSTRNNILTNGFFIIPAVLTLLFFCAYSLIFNSCQLVPSPKGVTDNPANCYIRDLPIDNSLAYSFSKNILVGQPKTTIDSWNLVDRPPIQVGAALSVSQFSSNESQSYSIYTLLSIFLQLSWIGAMFGLLIMAGLRLRQTLLVILLTGFSSFVFINSVFVWPKLFSAAVLLFGVGTLFAAKSADRARYMPAVVIVFAVSLLIHAGVIFTIIGVLPVLLFDVFGRSNRKYLNDVFKAGLVGLTIGVLLLAPWLVYKNSVTKTDRLIKWHFAGVIDAHDTRGTARTIKDSYGHISLKTWLNNKEANAKRLFEPTPIGKRLPGEAEMSYDLRWLRVNNFYITSVAIGLFNIGWLALLSRRVRLAVTPFDKRVLYASLFSFIAFVLLMFLPASTVLHQGSYAGVLLLYAVLGIFISRLRDRLLAVLVILQFFIFCSTWLLVGEFRSHLSSLLILAELGALLLLCVVSWRLASFRLVRGRIN